MQVKELSIRKTENYDTPSNTLIGIVKLEGHFGKQEVRLSNKSLSKIFEVIADDVKSTAHQNAAATGRAMQDAIEEPKLLEAQTIKIESGDDVPF